nr:EOG090X01LQ [Macrothrix elegans]
MLPSVGYFKSIVCPYFENDSCDRPYCQFRHEHLPVKQPKPTVVAKTHEPCTSQAPPESGDKSNAIEQIVSEAVKRVLKENRQLLENFDASKVIELVGQQKLVEKVVESLAPPVVQSPKKPEATVNNQQHKSKGHKTYNIPVGTPAYTPTPISLLNKTKPTVSKVENYVPKTSSSCSTATYKPSKVLPKSDSEETYTPSSTDSTSEIKYTPSSKTTDTPTSNDRYTPPSSSDCEFDYRPSTRELVSSEPSYSPSCSNLDQRVIDYSPSTISSLTTEPSYTPAQTSNPIEVDYTPSSLGSSHQLSPEKYLELFEADEPEPPKKPKSDQEDEEKKKKERERDKERERRRRREKEKKRQKEKEREKDREKGSSSKSSDSDSKSKRSGSSSNSSKHRSSSSSKKSKHSDSTPSKSKERYESKSSEATLHALTEMDSESDVDEECYRIFKEYQPTATVEQLDDQKKRKSEELPPLTEVVIPVKKQRIAHATGPTDAAPRPVSLAPPKAPPRLSPGMIMIERFKKLQEARATTTPAQPVPVASPSPSSSSKPNPFASPSCGGEKKRIAHVPNVMGLLSSKPKAATPSASLNQPAVQPNLPKPGPFGSNAIKKPNPSSGTGKAAPAVTSLPRPTIAVEMGCKVPANIRQRYLNILVDETLKIYDREQDAFERAVEEEKLAYGKSSSKVVYINVITNLVQRIRREVAENGTNNKNATNQGERKVMSHSAMLAGKGGATVSWSIERPKNAKIDTSLLKGAALYKLLERHVLTLELQDFNGYPRPDLNEKGRAVVNPANKFRQKPNVHLAADQRVCDRCGTVYQVNYKGLAVREDDMCSYHWGKPFQRRGETRYTCCKGEANSDGCSVAKWHVSDTASLDNLKGFVKTLPKSPPSDGNHGIYALDCEMCYTTEGPELTRVTVISTECQTVYETLVKPDNPILDYNTRFSGITEEDLMNVKTTIRDVQAVLLSKFSDKTILIGHSFDSDLRALKLIHDTVIDTSVVFPHSRGPPYKKALRTLCGEILQKIIQNDVGGHDSAEDAIACMELMLWKVKQDLKQMK